MFIISDTRHVRFWVFLFDNDESVAMACFEDVVREKMKTKKARKKSKHDKSQAAVVCLHDANYLLSV